MQSQAHFKEEVRNELEEFRLLMAQQQEWIESRIANVSSPSSPLTPQVILSSSTLPATLSSPSPLPSGSDLQSQMLLMLTDSFSKLSSALTEHKQDSKSDWYKFSGDSKKFHAWYLGIMAHISLPPWSELYNSSTNDVVASTTNNNLNGKLHS